MRDQCPYQRDSMEPHHTYNCVWIAGHEGPHEDYMGTTSGKWYVEGKLRCPSCRATFDRMQVGYVETTLPSVRQK